MNLMLGSSSARLASYDRSDSFLSTFLDTIVDIFVASASGLVILIDVTCCLSIYKTLLYFLLEVIVGGLV